MSEQSWSVANNLLRLEIQLAWWAVAMVRLVVMGTAVAQSVVSVSVVGVDLAVQAIGHLPANVPLDHQGLGGTA
jgi:hypothetical protein